jgi:hypothetical protein
MAPSLHTPVQTLQPVQVFPVALGRAAPITPKSAICGREHAFGQSESDTRNFL